MGLTVSNHTRDFDELVDIALQVLPEMALEDGVFSQKTVLDNGGYRNIGRNRLYTAMSLIGILEGGHADDPRVAALVQPAIESIASDIDITDDGAVLATTAWVLALTDDPRTRAVVDRMEAIVDPGRATSMQLGLVLAGLAIAAERRPDCRDNAALVANAAREELLQRWARRGTVFRGHRSIDDLRSLSHFRLASFASQVYPLHGFAVAAEHLGTPLPDQVRTTADWLVEC